MGKENDIKTRISSVRNTRQITSAMKMVSAARLNRIQQDLKSIRPFAEQTRSMLSHILPDVIPQSQPLMEKRDVKTIGLVVFSGDRGLCGAFNSNVFRKAITTIEENSPRNVKILTIGKKGRSFFRKRNYDVVQAYTDIYDDLSFTLVRTICDKITGLFTDRVVDEVYFVYNEFVTKIQQRLVSIKALPLDADLFEKDDEKRVVYKYEPSLEAICNTLLTKALTVQLYRTLIETYSAELGARMAAMDSATKNATDLIRDLTKFYNRARQASITQEVSEVVGGAEALKA